MLKMPTPLTNLEWTSLGVGFGVSFIVALLVIGSFLAFLKKKPIRYFAVYRIVFAFIVLIAGFFGLLSQVSF